MLRYVKSRKPVIPLGSTAHHTTLQNPFTRCMQYLQPASPLLDSSACHPYQTQWPAPDGGWWTTQSPRPKMIQAGRPLVIEILLEKSEQKETILSGHNPKGQKVWQPFCRGEEKVRMSWSLPRVIFEVDRGNTVQNAGRMPSLISK